MDFEIWNESSADVKQSIISQADPLTARSLCQSNRQSREICLNRLPAQVKFRSCLDSTQSARECDLIPMFSQRQFLQVIPSQIAIIHDDPLQLTHDFYSQNYKLPTEGFSEALRKAKVINTLVALSRPNILLRRADQFPLLPAYVDASQIDQLLSFYKQAEDDYIEYPDDSRTFEIMFGARSSSMSSVVSLHFFLDSLATHATFILDMISSANDTEKLIKIDDVYVAGYFRPTHYALAGATGARIIYRNLDGTTDAPNPFIMSRVIYDLVNKGFDEWTVHYSYLDDQSPRIQV